uniref:Uncharacterized protein n=2 Tax=Picea TaxID=3328 RepID=A0A124GMM7_PICGL|nr:hypothetical protein ABT39_MTgene1938 [Picea glauca]QHR89924.1 hypothetical protein Q903MT_gene3946 [Picea sitchensis]
MGTLHSTKDGVTICTYISASYRSLVPTHIMGHGTNVLSFWVSLLTCISRSPNLGLGLHRWFASTHDLAPPSCVCFAPRSYLTRVA